MVNERDRNLIGYLLLFHWMDLPSAVLSVPVSLAFLIDVRLQVTAEATERRE